MKASVWIKTSIAVLAMGGLMLAPADAIAQGKSKGKGNSKSQSKSQNKSHWNAAPPKKNGRHDNRDWNKNTNSRQSDEWRRREEERRRQASYEEWRRRQAAQNRSVSDRDRFLNSSQSSLQRESDRRQQTKNEWRNLAYLSGAVAIIGLLEKDNRLVFAGATGALYSLHRYEQDRKSQSAIDRARAYYFSQPYFYRNGTRFERRLVTRDGQRYYQFVRK